MKKLLLMLTFLISWFSMIAQDQLIQVCSLDYTLFDKVTRETSPNDKGTYGYTSSFTADNGFWSIFGFNNNGNSKTGVNKSGPWQEIRCGLENDASTPYIYNAVDCGDVVDVIEIKIGTNFKTSDKINSFKVISASDAEFKNDVIEEDFTSSFRNGKVNGTLLFELENRKENARFYKLAWDLASASKNGFISIQKVSYYKESSSLDYIRDSYEVNPDDVFPSPVINNPENLEITGYTSSNEAIATVDEQGIVTLTGKYGETVITALAGSASASYTLKVTKKDPGIHYHDVVFSVDVREFPANPVLPTLVNPNDLDLDNKIQFTSSDTNVATVDNATGVVTVVGNGTTKISATYVEDEKYKECTASYTLAVVNLDPFDETFDFVNNSYDYTVESDNSHKYLDKAIFTEGDIVIKYDKETTVGNGIRFWSDGLRIYEGSFYLNISENYPDCYLSEVKVTPEEMTFKEKDSAAKASSTWTNSDFTKESVDFMFTRSGSSKASSSKAIKSIVVKVAPKPITMTPGGYYNEPVDVIISGDEDEKGILVYYADGTLDEFDYPQTKSIRLEKSAMINVFGNNAEMTQTYVVTREISVSGSGVITYNEDADAYFGTVKITSISDQTKDIEDGYKDLEKPDGYVLYVGDTEIGEITEGQQFDLKYITPDIKVVSIKEEPTRKLITTNISDQINWTWPSDSYNYEKATLQKKGEKHMVAIDDNKMLRTEIRLEVNHGSPQEIISASVLKDMPVEFVITDNSHENAFLYFHNTNATDHELRYVVPHGTGYENRDSFISQNQTVSFTGQVGYRFVTGEAAEGPQAVRRRAGETPKYTTTTYLVGEPVEISHTFDTEGTDNSEMSGVEDVTVEAAGEVEYFNIQGVRLNAEPTSGLYIRRQGGVARKVVR